MNLPRCSLKKTWKILSFLKNIGDYSQSLSYFYRLRKISNQFFISKKKEFSKIFDLVHLAKTLDLLPEVFYSEYGPLGLL